jgi:hypothetical protein
MLSAAFSLVPFISQDKVLYISRVEPGMKANFVTAAKMVRDSFSSKLAVDMKV